ncbi:CD9 antigen-like [Petromyzon marinus]|uniref:CD9 antigen-like n=1 Tax=Petromyzon marinus TaxID=7757 RepID=UPI003F71AC1B
MKCLKCLLLTFNVVLSICGFAVSGSALWLRFDQITESIFSCAGTSSIFLKGVYVLIGAGVLMILTGFLGCRAVTKESQWMLGTYFLCLLLIFVAEVAAGGYSVSNKDKVKSPTHHSVSPTLAQRRSNVGSTLNQRCIVAR